MIKTLLIAASALAATATLSTAALAADATTTPQTYASVGILSQNAHRSDTTLDGLNFRLGTRITPYWGVEGEAAFGTDKDNKAAGAYKLTREFGAYGVGYVPVSSNFDLIGRVGLSDSRIKMPATAAHNETGTAIDYGVGAQYHFQNGYAVRGDLTQSDFINQRGVTNKASLNLVKAF